MYTLTEEQQAAIKAKTFLYLGFKMKPSFKSPQGTGAICQSIQGWLWIKGGADMWHSSKKDAMKSIDDMRARWEDGTIINTSRDYHGSALKTWGENEKIKAARDERKRKQELAEIKQKKDNALRSLLNVWQDKGQEMFDELKELAPDNQLVQELEEEIRPFQNVLKETA